MSSLDDAIEVAQSRYFASAKETRRAARIAVKLAVESGHLIAADDRDALLAALGAEQIGWQHTVRIASNEDGVAVVLLPTHRHVNNAHTAVVECDECTDCVPVYKINPPTR